MKTVLIEIVKAEYVSGYKIKLYFKDNTEQVVDFTTFFEKATNPAELRYKPIDNFKKFSVEDGNIVWGENWDIVLPLSELYKGIVSV